MSQQDGFAGGFLLGALVGGAMGGVVGALIASRFSSTKPSQRLEDSEDPALEAQPEQAMEVARQNLEDKIAQLNDAIEAVRQQVRDVNERPGDRESSLN